MRNYFCPVNTRDWLIPALGVAASPLPVAAMLLVLGGRHAIARGASFWLAWMVGVGAATAGFVVLTESVDEYAGVTQAIALGEIVVGVLLVVLALRLWLVRGARSNELPAWLLAVDRAGPGEAAALGVALSALNPKNLALVLSGASAIAEGSDVRRELALSALGFVAVAVSIVSALLAGRLLAARRTAGVFAALRSFAARHGRSLTLVLGVVVGLYFVVDGLRRF
jgi:hypothetical protein